MIWDQIKTWLVNLCTLGALLEKYKIVFILMNNTLVVYNS